MKKHVLILVSGLLIFAGCNLQNIVSLQASHQITCSSQTAITETLQIKASQVETSLPEYTPEYKDAVSQIIYASIKTKYRTSNSEGVSIILPLLTKDVSNSGQQRIFVFAYYGEFAAEDTKLLETNVRIKPYELYTAVDAKGIQHTYFAELLYPQDLPSLEPNFDPETKIKELIKTDTDKTIYEQASILFESNTGIVQEFYHDMLQFDKKDIDSQLQSTIESYIEANKLYFKSYVINKQEYSV